MRAVLQRVASASVTVGGVTVASIGPGLLVLVGIAEGDTAADLEFIGRKIVGTRLFPGGGAAGDAATAAAALPKPWSVAVADDPTKSVLLVSQFTLLGSVRRGTKPDFGRAMKGAGAAALFDGLVDRVRAAVREPAERVQTGVFGAMMQVALVNDGPVTLMIDSRTAPGPRSSKEAA